MKSIAVRRRPTVRVLLLDREDRLLLIRGRLPHAPASESHWFTIGGGAEPGESLADTALREIREEAGFAEVELGPVVWLREAMLLMHDGLPSRLEERYVVARCDGGEPDRGGWDEHERDLCDDIRWWSFEDLVATSDRAYPERLLELLPAILAGDFPSEPIDITVLG